MLILKYILLAVIALCAGGLTAAGYFAFITAIGIITTFAQRTHTSSHITRYEDAIIIGAILGNLWWCLGVKVDFGSVVANNVFLGMIGLFYGIFTGSMILAIAETIKALPVFFRRTGITAGVTVMVVIFAVGKTVGNVLYTLLGLAAH